MVEEERSEEVGQEPVMVPAPSPQPEVEEEKDNTSDLFKVEREDVSDLADVSEEVEVTEEDVMGDDDADMSDDVLAVPEQEDLSDLFEVGGDTSGKPKKSPKSKRFKRTPKTYPPAVGGMRGISQ